MLYYKFVSATNSFWKNATNVFNRQKHTHKSKTVNPPLIRSGNVNLLWNGFLIKCTIFTFEFRNAFLWLHLNDHFKNWGKNQGRWIQSRPKKLPVGCVWQTFRIRFRTHVCFKKTIHDFICDFYQSVTTKNPIDIKFTPYLQIQILSLFQIIL